MKHANHGNGPTVHTYTARCLLGVIYCSNINSYTEYSTVNKYVRAPAAIGRIHGTMYDVVHAMHTHAIYIHIDVDISGQCCFVVI